MSGTIPTPEADILREVRFAVVLYGGISLAIYINGIAQELLAMVRATSGKPPSNTGAEAVYRKIATLLPGQTKLSGDDTIHTRFVVDILSGTSAGGINGVFLAKAIANGETLDKLEELWVKDGDVDQLLADGHAASRPFPRALFDSGHMYEILRNALETQKPDSVPGSLIAPHDELDLYITATDLHGQVVELPLANATMRERKFRSVFRFSARHNNASLFTQNDLAPQHLPFLAFAARCTSSIPPAFDAFRLQDVPLPNPGTGKDWERFYRGYHKQPRGLEAFPGRAFGDGGYLDNKPFSYATQALMRRRASDVPVERKLIYIEPSPETVDQNTAFERPDILRNSLDALITYPRAETIREDLEAILARNEILDEVSRQASYFLDQLLSSNTSTIPPTGPIADSYGRLREKAARDHIADLLAEAWGCADDTDERRSLQKKIDVWLYARYGGNDGHGGLREGKKFLAELDLLYCTRYLNFLARLTSRMGTGDFPQWKEFLAKTRPQAASVEQNLHDLKNLREEKAAIGSLLRLVRDEGRDLRSRRTGPEDTLPDIPPDPGALDNPADAARLHKRLVKRFAQWQAGVAGLHGKLAAATEADSPASRFLAKCSSAFALYDMLSFPIFYGTEAGESSKVEIHRFSEIEGKRFGVGDWTYPGLLGRHYSAFGAFFDKKWRLNDILVGRLHGAACLINALLPDDFDPAQKADLVREAHTAILQECQGKSLYRDYWKDTPHPAATATPAPPQFPVHEMDRFSLIRIVARGLKITSGMLRGLVDARPRPAVVRALQRATSLMLSAASLGLLAYAFAARLGKKSHRTPTIRENQRSHPVS